MTAFDDALAGVAGATEQARTCWEAVNGDGLATVDPRMALAVLDTALVFTPLTAVHLFQQTVQAERKAVIGRVALAQYRIRKRSLGGTQLVEIYLERRMRRHHCDLMRDPELKAQRKEWMTRLNALCTTVGINPLWSEL